MGSPKRPGLCWPGGFCPEASRYLLAFERDDDLYDYRYERPHYAWADTVVRPMLPVPDVDGTARVTGAGLDGRGTTRHDRHLPDHACRGRSA